MHLTVAHDFLPKTPSANAAVVMDSFGIGFEDGRHTIAENLELPIQDGDVVLLTGPSGSGKSSLMRAAAGKLSGVLNADNLDLGDAILVDRMGLPVKDALALLSACGLSEARLLLRTPAELSDGQRYRFRLALAAAAEPKWIVADEFTATLDRVLAKVIAYNIRRMSSRTGIGFLLATTHEDIAQDLAANVRMRCALDGHIEVSTSRLAATRRPRRGARVPRVPSISFAKHLSIIDGTKRDWPGFAAWHYRSHHLGIVRKVTLLMHDDEPIGICVFTSPALSLAQRNRFFGKRGGWSSTSLKALNAQLATLSRVVIHPTYRGAGLAAWFIHQSCQSCRWPWIEALAQMGHLNPFFEKAGFTRVGVSAAKRKSRKQHSAIYGGGRTRDGQKANLISEETNRKSRYAEPVYYIFDNRQRDCGEQQADAAD